MIIKKILQPVAIRAINFNMLHSGCRLSVTAIQKDIGAGEGAVAAVGLRASVYRGSPERNFGPMPEDQSGDLAADKTNPNSRRYHDT
jgi:hypothetical protein